MVQTILEIYNGNADVTAVVVQADEVKIGLLQMSFRYYFHRMGDTPLTQIMQCLSIAIQNPGARPVREFVYPVLYGTGFPRFECSP